MDTKDRAGSGRLSREAWTDLGLKTLEEEGFTALKAEALAKKLGVSRGSFYWHFNDVEAYEAAILERWRDLILAALDVPLAGIKPPRERLRTLMTSSLRSRRRVEIAMRAWATVKPSLRAALARIDEKRLGYMRDLIGQCGTPEARTGAIAHIFYFTYLGQSRGEPRTDAEIDAIVSELLSLI